MRKVTTRIQKESPDAIAQDAQAAGLLTPQALGRKLPNALVRSGVSSAAAALLSVAVEVAAAGIPPMPMEVITAEVKAARKER
jgi:hypothetical protein